MNGLLTNIAITNAQHNGNITAYVDSQGATVASYTYDAFGNTIAQSGSMSNSFTHRFSTKYLDQFQPTGNVIHCPLSVISWYYYGYRFYSPSLSRWLNRDPIEEQGGLNLYTFCGNNGVSAIDLLGMETIKFTEEVQVGYTRRLKPYPYSSLGRQEYEVKPLMGDYEITIEYNTGCDDNNEPYIEVLSVTGNLKSRRDSTFFSYLLIGHGRTYEIKHTDRSSSSKIKGLKLKETRKVYWTISRVHYVSLSFGIGPVGFELKEVESGREILKKGTYTITKECCNE